MRIFFKALKQEQLAVKFGPAPQKTAATTAAPSTVRQTNAFKNHALHNKIQAKVFREIFFQDPFSFFIKFFSEHEKSESHINTKLRAKLPGN